MSDAQAWNDEAREGLRDSLRAAIVGELRLAKRGHRAILDLCRDVYIEEECPAGEVDEFLRFTAGEVDRLAGQLAAEGGAWPAETDCDRLDRVEAALARRGILLWQASPCCDTCTRGELRGRIEEVDRRRPGFRDRVRGYAFFIDQNLPESLAHGTQLDLYLGYGWLPPGRAEVPPEAYEGATLGIAHEVCECLRAEGFEADWDGRLARKIGLSLDWRRRTLLDE